MIKRKSTPSYIYFNSIKVRLEPLVGLLKVTSALFQFHKGTIRTDCKMIVLQIIVISIP